MKSTSSTFHKYIPPEVSKLFTWEIAIKKELMLSYDSE